MKRKPAEGGMHRFSTTPEQERLIADECRRTGRLAHMVFRKIVEAGFDAIGEGKERAPGRRAGEEAPATRAVGLANLAERAISDYAMFYMLRRIMSALGQDPDDRSIHPLAIAGCIGGTDCGTLIGVWDSAGTKLAGGEDAYSAIVAACAENGMTASMLAGAGPAPGKPHAERKGKPKEDGNAKRKHRQKR